MIPGYIKSSDECVNFLNTVIDISFNQVLGGYPDNNSPFVPFSLSNKKKLEKYAILHDNGMLEVSDDMIEQAKSSISQNKEGNNFVIFSHDGRMNLENGNKQDAIITYIYDFTNKQVSIFGTMYEIVENNGEPTINELSAPKILDFSEM